MSRHPVSDGLELVASEDRGAQWEWDVTDVWVDEAGKYYVYSGMGCSCNRAYDNYFGIGDLDGPYTAAQVLHEVSYTLKERLIRAGV